MQSVTPCPSGAGGGRGELQQNTKELLFLLLLLSAWVLLAEQSLLNLLLLLNAWVEGNFSHSASLFLLGDQILLRGYKVEASGSAIFPLCILPAFCTNSGSLRGTELLWREKNSVRSAQRTPLSSVWKIGGIFSLVVSSHTCRSLNGYGIFKSTGQNFWRSLTQQLLNLAFWSYLKPVSKFRCFMSLWICL